MKNLTVIKTILVTLICLGVIAIATNVFADNTTFTDLTNTLNATNTSSNTTSSNTTTNLTSSNTATNTSTNTANTTKVNTVNTTNTTNKTNTSSYNNTNTNLPSTGLQDSMPIVVLVVVLGISAVYAYKKVKDYKEI